LCVSSRAMSTINIARRWVLTGVVVNKPTLVAIREIQEMHVDQGVVYNANELKSIVVVKEVKCAKAAATVAVDFEKQLIQRYFGRK